MPDWSKSMQQTFEYYEVDPATWKDKRRLTNVTSCSISWDEDTDTKGTATIDAESLFGECYIRIYLITVQNGIREKHPLGTFMIQTPSSGFDGKVHTVTMDAYTPLIELKEKYPPYGYSIRKGENVMDYVGKLTQENLRAPVVKTIMKNTLYADFVAQPDDTWVTFLNDLLAKVKYKFTLDELGRVLYSPDQDPATLQPIHTFDDSDDSILFREITMEHDLYGLYNAVEVIYSNGSDNFYAKVVNDDPNSQVSTVNRGREIVYRETDPSFTGQPTEAQIRDYAKNLLKELSSIEYTIEFSHAYCGVRMGDCVRINYKRAGLDDVRAKIISQSIKCEPGCPVTAKAVFTNKLWG